MADFRYSDGKPILKRSFGNHGFTGLLFGGLAAGYGLSLGGCTPPHIDYHPENRRGYADRVDGSDIDLLDNDIRWLPKLTVNRESYKTGRQCSWEEGLEDIKEIVKTATDEEAWMYIDQKKVWIEIGKNQTAEEAAENLKKLGIPAEKYILGGQIQVDMHYLVNFLSQNKYRLKDLKILHIHTEAVDRARAKLYDDRFEKESGQPAPGQIKEINLIYASIVGSLPAETDILPMVLRTRRASTLNGSLKYSEYVGSSCGVTGLFLTGDGSMLDPSMKRDDVATKVAQSKKPVKLKIPLEVFAKGSSSSEVQDFKEENLKQICKEWSTPEMFFVYMPYPSR